MGVFWNKMVLTEIAIHCRFSINLTDCAFFFIETFLNFRMFWPAFLFKSTINISILSQRDMILVSLKKYQSRLWLCRYILRLVDFLLTDLSTVRIQNDLAGAIVNMAYVSNVVRLSWKWAYFLSITNSYLNKAANFAKYSLLVSEKLKSCKNLYYI